MSSLIKPRPFEDAPTGAPFLDARKEWDSRFGAVHQTVRTWRLVAYILMGALVISIGGIVFLGTRAKVAAYYVRVDDNLKTEAIPVKESAFKPKESEIKYFVDLFVKRFRTVSPDPFLQKENVGQGYFFTSGKAKLQYQEKAKAPNSALDPVTVEIKSIVRASEESFQVRWIETTYGQDGNRKEEVPYTGFFTYVVIPPQEESQLRVNPLGLYIRAMDITQDFKSK